MRVLRQRIPVGLGSSLATRSKRCTSCNGPSDRSTSTARTWIWSSRARDQVIGTPLAQQAFAIVDVIWLNDPRIAEITGRGWQ